MKLKCRLIRLEKSQRKNTGSTVFVLVEEGVSQEMAIERWKTQNPNKPVPENLMRIMLVPFSHEH